MRIFSPPVLAMIFAGATLAGCETYDAEPLLTAIDLNILPVPAHAIDMTEAASLAVLRSPDLNAARRKWGVAEAQAFAAGLLPDPQISLSADKPVPPGYVNGYALGISEDLMALLLQPSKSAAAAAARDQAKLSLLWDEWATIEKAASLYAQKAMADQKLAVLGALADALKLQAEHSSRALAKRDSTIDAAGADLSAAFDAESAHAAAARDALKDTADLKMLLGLSPLAELDLKGLGDPPSMPKEDVVRDLAQITTTRPDLLALQAGYRAQEEAVWQAVLAQFPGITLGANHAADTSNVHSNGLSITFNLPIFAPRGQIRVARATREQLHAEYQARLDQTTIDAWRVWQEMELLRAQIGELGQNLPSFRIMAARARKAYAAGDLSAATNVVLQTSLTARESEYLDLKAALWADTISLHTLLGIPFVADALPKNEHRK